MGDVVVDISMSLDGFVTAPGADLEHGLGLDGEAIHRWAISDKTDADENILDAAVADAGAVVMGRKLFDTVDGPHGWSEEMGYGGERDQTGGPPIIVVTHRAPETTRLGSRFRFATEGIESAIDQATEVAGDKNVFVMGGAGVIQSVLAAELADEIHIHLAPVLFGGGTRLFEHLPVGTVQLQHADVVATPHATHVTYRLSR